MKNAFLFLLLLSSFFAQSQSLKDALFGGKLKNQPGTVIRKSDDIAAKIDTAYKVPAADTARVTATPAPTETATKIPATQTDASTSSATDNKTDATTPVDSVTVITETIDSTEGVAAKPKDNNAIWKEYAKTLTETLKTETLPSKKIKKGDYYVLVSYAIETDGKVTVTDVFVDPANDFLQQQIKDRLSLEVPKLNPVLNSAGMPRKVNKKYNFTLTKE